uniref:Uncharacterized protein n=1 Tax=Anguilla anguilla TaxID=7936 RepID=A0A0E9U0G4_ANGAN
MCCLPATLCSPPTELQSHRSHRSISPLSMRKGRTQRTQGRPIDKPIEFQYK